jgi:hypothetical protein
MNVANIAMVAAIVTSLVAPSVASAQPKADGFYGMDQDGAYVFVGDFGFRHAKDGEPGSAYVCPYKDGKRQSWGCGYYFIPAAKLAKLQPAETNMPVATQSTLTPVATAATAQTAQQPCRWMNEEHTYVACPIDGQEPSSSLNASYVRQQEFMGVWCRVFRVSATGQQKASSGVPAALGFLALGALLGVGIANHGHGYSHNYHDYGQDYRCANNPWDNC